MTDRFEAANHCPAVAGSQEVASDAIQLLTIATFNGLCRLMTALTENGALTAEDLRSVYAGMVEPLDDPGLRDDATVVGARETLEAVLADAVARVAKSHGS